MMAFVNSDSRATVDALAAQYAADITTIGEAEFWRRVLACVSSVATGGNLNHLRAAAEYVHRNPGVFAQ